MTGEVNKSLVNIVDVTLTALFGKKDDAPKRATPSNTKTVSTPEEFRKAFDELVS